MRSSARTAVSWVTVVGLAWLGLMTVAASGQGADLASSWVRSFGTGADDAFSPLDQTGDGGYVFGGWSGEVSSAGAMTPALFKLSSAGAVQWAKSYGGAAVTMAEVAPTADGGFVVAGTSPASVFDATFWLVKLDSSGAIQWQKSYGSFGVGFVTAVPLAGGGFLLAGASYELPAFTVTLTVMRLDASGNISWQQELAGSDAVFGFPMPLADGSFMVVGSRADASLEGSDGWLLKLSASGGVEWQQAYGGADDELLVGVIPTADGGWLAQGAIATEVPGGDPTSDAWLVKLGPTGAVEWQKRYGGPADDYGFALEDPSGGYLMSGYTESYGAGGADSWVLRLSSAGAVTWAKTYGGAGDDEAYALPDAAGGYLLVGQSDSFGAGGQDGWLAKLDSSGGVTWQRSYGGPADDSLELAGRAGAIVWPLRPGRQPLLWRGVPVDAAAKVAADELLVAGSTRSFGAGGEDTWAATLDASGAAASCACVGQATATAASAAVTVASTSAAAFPSGIVATAGDRTVGSLALTSSSLTLSAEDLCAATPSLTASASASPTSGPAPLTVTFTGSASNGVPPYGYDWDFGDSSAHSSQQSPTHTYAVAGTFTARLTVTDAAGATDTASVTITVTGGGGCQVSCSASVPASAAVGAPVSFAATVTASGCLSTPLYVWSFGDGGVAMQQNASHAYAAAGDYDWGLVVTWPADAAVCSDDGTITVGGSGGGTTLDVPGVAHAPGAQGSAWRSNVAAVNRGASATTLALRYTPDGGGAAVERSVNLGAGATVEWQDILVSLFGVADSAAAKGTVRLESDQDVVAVARTFNQGAAGTFGQYLPAVDQAQAQTSGQVGVIPLLKASSAFRSNLGVLNVGDATATVAVRLFDAGGSQVGSTLTRDVPPGEYGQWNNVFTAAGAGSQDSAYATVEVETAGARVWAFGSVVDNVTSDPTTVPAVVDPPAGVQLVTGVAHAPGAQGSAWRTNVAAVNRSASAVNLVLTFTPEDGSAPVVRNHVLGAGDTVEWQDILVSLFGYSASAQAKGTVALSSATPVYAVARTYNQGASGTFGQFLPAVATRDAVAAGEVGVIPMLKASSAFRSNLGVLNLGAGDCAVRVTLRGASGAAVGSPLTRTVPGGQAYQWNNVFSAAGAGSQDIGYATVEVTTPGGRVWAFGSVVDNGTSDPTTVPVLE